MNKDILTYTIIATSFGSIVGYLVGKYTRREEKIYVVPSKEVDEKIHILLKPRMKHINAML